MWPYWILFLVPTWMAIQQVRAIPPLPSDRLRWSLSWVVCFVLLTLMIGLRFEVGGDWFNYIEHIESAAQESFTESLERKDPAYATLNWFGANWFGNIYLINTVCAVFFCLGLIKFSRAQPRPWLALVIAVPYLVTVVAMGYSRQGVAIGLGMLGLVALIEGRVLQFVLWIALAATFHKSAVILLGMTIFMREGRRLVNLLGIGVAGAALYGLLLMESIDALQEGYLEAGYQSSGALVRVAMNALPGLTFLVFRSRFQLAPEQQSFWTGMSALALGFVGLLVISPSSTAVDRVALYLIPLQLFVWSRLPDALGRPGKPNTLWVSAVIGYSMTVHFVWLVFSDYSWTWLPYRFYWWELI
jgi:hypothetical protein